jgi:hypothetical protein
LNVIGGCHADAARLMAGDLGCILQADRPKDMPAGEFERRLADVQHWLATNPAEAQMAIREVLAHFREKLEFQLQVVTLREERDDLRAQADAAGTPTKERILRLRYLRASDRGCQGALRELRRLQSWRLEHGAELRMQAQAGAPGPATDSRADTAPKTEAEPPPVEAPDEPAQPVSRTEAAAPQGGAGLTSCSDDLGTAAGAGRVGASPGGARTLLPAARAGQEGLEKSPDP